jgi:RsiW-degrading membrane proteinase PrsW (M82 family)
MSKLTSQTRSERRFNLFMAVTGTLIPVGYLVWYATKHKKLPTPGHIAKEAFSTPVGTLFSLDLILCSILFLKQAHQEVKTGKAQGPFWLYAFLNSSVALSSAWPMLLLRRKKA